MKERILICNPKSFRTAVLTTIAKSTFYILLEQLTSFFFVYPENVSRSHCSVFSRVLWRKEDYFFFLTEKRIWWEICYCLNVETMFTMITFKVVDWLINLLSKGLSTWQVIWIQRIYFRALLLFRTHPQQSVWTEFLETAVVCKK